MIDPEELQSNKALKILKSYEGPNPYITYLRRTYEKKSGFELTNKQEKFIVENQDVEPIEVDKVIEITQDLGEQLKHQEDLSFVPERVYFGSIVSDNEKAYLILGKMKKNQKNNEFYWIPKVHVVDDPHFDPPEVDVDFTKYEEMDALDRHPYGHQKEAVKFLVPRKGAILADEMGAGKTYSILIAALEVNPEKVLVVCPANMKITWYREIESLGETDINIVGGSIWDDSKFTIVNYDILKNFHTPFNERSKMDKNDISDVIRNAGFDMVIVDEAHKIKNNKSKRGKIVKEICVDNPTVKTTWLLTGTPISNKPMDYFNLLRTINSDLTNDWMFFAKRYCKAFQINKPMKNGKTKKIWITDGASNLEELGQKTKNLILRRKKEDVLDLPDKMTTPMVYELTKKEWDEYDNLWDEYLEERMKEGKKGAPQKDLVELTLLRQFIANAAVSRTTELAEDVLEQNDNNKVVIFTSFQEEQDELAKHFGKKCVIHNGTMTDTDKQKSIDDFQNKKNKKVFIGNIQSAGVGITLTASNYVIFNSFSWVPGDNEQAENRCHRISQNNKVTIFYQLFKDTISEYMWGVLKNKKEIINRLLNEEDNQYKKEYLEKLKSDVNS